MKNSADLSQPSQLFSPEPLLLREPLEVWRELTFPAEKSCLSAGWGSYLTDSAELGGGFVTLPATVASFPRVLVSDAGDLVILLAVSSFVILLVFSFRGTPSR